MNCVNLAEELRSNTYPGRGIVLGRSEDGKKAVIAYFIMGRSENSRNRVFVEQDGGIRTEAFAGPRTGQQDHRHQRRSDRHRLRLPQGRQDLC